MWIPCFIPLYSPLNLYLIILWILDFKYILLLLLLLLHAITFIAEAGCNVHLSSSGIHDRDALEINLVMINGKIIYPERRYDLTNGMVIVKVTLTSDSCEAVSTFTFEF